MKASSLLSSLAVLFFAAGAGRRAEVYAPEASHLAALRDAGFVVASGHGPYRLVQGGRRARDGGFLLPRGVELLDAQAPFECACSTGDGCQVDGGAAPLGLTLPAGAWSGAGCVHKACVEMFGGASSWPAQCPCPRDGGC